MNNTNTIYICKFCGKECKNKNSLIQHEIRCRHNDDRIVKPKIKYCLNCNKILNKKSQSLYCSSSCAAKVNNKKRTHTTKGKTIKKICIKCGIEFDASIHINKNKCLCNMIESYNKQKER